MRTDAGSLKRGSFIKVQNDLFQVVKTEHNFRGRGSATMRIKVKNLKTGNQLEMSFKTSETIEIPDIDVVEMQYLYKDTHALYFMNKKSFEQHAIPTGLIGRMAHFLKEGDNIFVLMNESHAIAIRPPQTVQLKVIESEEAVKGDTAMSAKKNAIVETGISVAVPLFIKTGDIIVINPETGAYVERTSE